jgi:hypothetical protein
MRTQAENLSKGRVHAHNSPRADVISLPSSKEGRERDISARLRPFDGRLGPFIIILSADITIAAFSKIETLTSPLVLIYGSNQQTGGFKRRHEDR